MTNPPGTCHFFVRPALESYATWAQRTFSPEQLGTPPASPDAVANPLGVSNFLCYAMGLNPHIPDTGLLPRVERDPIDGGWGFRFQIRPNAADFSWRAATSVDLRMWSNFAGAANSTTYGGDAHRHFRKVSLSTTPPSFFRMELTPWTE